MCGEFNSGKTLTHTWLLPMLYKDQHAAKVTNNFKDIHNTYIDKDEKGIICVDKSYSPIYNRKFSKYYAYQYNLFKKGHYSKFDGFYKLRILKFWLCNELLFGILFKTKYIKEYRLNKGQNIYSWTEDCEYWRKPVIKTEIY